MKKFLLIGFIVVALIAGFIFVTFSPNNADKDSDSGNTREPFTTVIGENHRQLAEGHLRTAVKKQSLDATDKKEVEITIGDFYYDPTAVKIKKGTTVTWRNNGMIGHDVKIDSSSPQEGPGSELLGRQQSYSYTFDEPGLYLYYCSPHPVQMRAVIEVVE
jgi:plastocyanin